MHSPLWVACEQWTQFSKGPMFEHIANECRLIAHRLRGQGRVITFVWILSLISITHNEAVDEVGKETVVKCEVNSKRIQSLTQARGNIKTIIIKLL